MQTMTKMKLMTIGGVVKCKTIPKVSTPDFRLPKVGEYYHIREFRKTGTYPSRIYLVLDEIPSDKNCNVQLFSPDCFEVPNMDDGDKLTAALEEIINAEFDGKDLTFS